MNNVYTGRIAVSSSSIAQLTITPQVGILEAVAVLAVGTPDFSKIGFQLLSREKLLIPAPGSNDDSTFTTNAAGYAPITPLNAGLHFIKPLSLELSGPPYEVRVKIANNDTSAVIVMVVLLVRGFDEQKPIHVILEKSGGESQEEKEES